jgi:hypothetical protein
MKYLEWNNAIAEYFFNTENAGKDVLLYITKSDIINIGKQHLQMSEQEIWQDYILSIKNGLPSGTLGIIDKSIHAYEQWIRKPRPIRIQEVDLLYPTYIGYLALFVLPLTESHGEFSTNNYYGRLNKLLSDNNINEPRISTPIFSKTDVFWENLSQWANVVKNRDLGCFYIRKFGNENWIYVGKPFSQCVFEPKSIKKLPELFFISGMTPDTFYTTEEIRKNVLTYGASILGIKDNVLELIKKSDNELGQSIIEIIKREHQKWTGESHELILNGTIERTKRNYTVAPLLLQFKVKENDGIIILSYRMHSSNDYPEDLKFGIMENLYETNGYSKTLDLPFKEEFDLKDDFNKWIAKFTNKDIRLFISAGAYQLSTDYWIETEHLSKTDWMFLLCKNECKESIVEWGKHFKNGNFREQDFEGIPDNYSLFKFLNPQDSHKEYQLLTIYTEKFVALVNGLKINFRTYLYDYLPEVEVVNSEGNEAVYLQYKNAEEQFILQKKQSDSNRWLLPKDITLNLDFYIKVKGEDFSKNEFAYVITSADNSATKVSGEELPKRNTFGRKADDAIEVYSLGSNTVGINSLKQIPYQSLFRGIKEDTQRSNSLASYEPSSGNILLSYLTLKKVSTIEEFYKAFEFLHSTEYGRQRGNDINYSSIKRASINFYDYLGFLDYDYESKKIVINSPQLIFIPTNEGRKVLLIGGRDKVLVESMINLSHKYNLQVEIIKQHSSNQNLLLPDAVVVKSFGTSRDVFGENNIKAFSEELNIKFNSNDLVQVGLQLFSADIDEYGAELLNHETNQDDYDWARRIFDVNALCYVRSSSSEFDQSFSLIEYKLNEYTYYNKLWKYGKCYSVDRNWGKYLALKHSNKQVILYDKKSSKVAVPIELPLPRLMSESIMLLSGLAPAYAFIDGISYRIYENIPSVFIKNLFNKLKQETIDYNF